MNTATAVEKKQNLQDTFLNSVRRSKTPLTIFLVNGVKLQGVVSWFDNFCVLLRRDGQSQLVYKHAISTIMPAQPVQLYEPGPDRTPIDRKQSSIEASRSRRPWSFIRTGPGARTCAPRPRAWPRPWAWPRRSTWRSVEALVAPLRAPAPATLLGARQGATRSASSARRSSSTWWWSTTRSRRCSSATSSAPGRSR